MKSWRPLTLLNTDNKIYGKILANQLSTIVTDIVHHSQTGFVRGRHAAKNIIKIMEIISQSDITSEDNLLISYDFEKAFDSLEWQTIFFNFRIFQFWSQIYCNGENSIHRTFDLRSK